MRLLAAVPLSFVSVGGCTPVSESSGSEGRKTNRATVASSGQTQGESVVVG